MQNAFSKYSIYLVASLPIFGLIYLSVFKPMYFPITDDWYYIPWGYHQINPGSKTDFELVTGHQQIITKYTIWLFGFIPGLYPKYVGILNCFFGVTGFLLLIIANLKYINKKINSLYLVCIFVLAFSFKPFYMYAMVTALGPMQAIFCIGAYYYIKNINHTRLSKLLLIVIIFLSPFTTGLGLIVPLAEISEGVYRSLSKKYSIRKNIPLLISALTGIVFAYILPLLKHNISSRADGGTKNLLNNNIESLNNPLGLIGYFFGLNGNIFVPSSRYEPILPIFFGVLFLCFVLFFARPITKIDAQDILLNRNSIIAGMLFIVLIITTRFNGERDQIMGSAAPRYVIGYVVLIVGIISLLVKKNGPNLIFMFMIMVFTTSSLVSGLKTGLEWHSIRSQQTFNVVQCLKKYPNSLQNINPICFNLAYQLRFENTDTETFNNELLQYLKISGLLNDK